MKKFLLIALLPMAAFANPCTATFTGNCNASTGNQTVQGQGQDQQATAGAGANSVSTAAGGSGGSVSGSGNSSAAGGAVKNSGNSTDTVNSAGGTGGAGGAGGNSASKSSAVSTQGNTQVSNTSYSYGPPPVINPVRIVQCGVAIDAGGSSTRGAGGIGVTFTTEECWNSNYAAMEEGAGRLYDACVMRRLSKTEQRAIKNGAKFEDCLPTPPTVVEKIVYVDRPVEVIKYVDRPVPCASPVIKHHKKVVACKTS